jgi:hypothetical protein
MTSKFQTRAYFHWLETHIRIPDNGRSYDGLLEVMYLREFVWVVGNDENRIADGRDLRLSYLDSLSVDDHEYDKARREDPVSFLEVLIGLSIRAAFITDSDAKEWAWKLIENLGLHRMSDDELSEENIDRIHDVLDTVIFRTYQEDGSGGFFPLILSNNDQTTIEIWYQMAAYVEENRASYGL